MSFLTCVVICGLVAACDDTGGDGGAGGSGGAGGMDAALGGAGGAGVEPDAMPDAERPAPDAAPADARIVDAAPVDATPDVGPIGGGGGGGAGGAAGQGGGGGSIEAFGAAVDRLAIAPGDAPACPDIDADGEPDNDFGASDQLRVLLNAALELGVGQSLVYLFELRGETLAFFTGVESETPDPVPAYVVDAGALDESGAPRVTFVAEVDGDVLHAEGPTFPFQQPGPAGPIELDIDAPDLRAIIETDGTGLTMSDGILAGTVARDGFITALQGALDACEARPEISVACTLLVDIEAADLWPAEGDRASICIAFTAAPARLVLPGE